MPGELAGPLTFNSDTEDALTEVSNALLFSILAGFQLNKYANTAVFRNYKKASILTGRTIQMQKSPPHNFFAHSTHDI